MRQNYKDFAESRSQCLLFVFIEQLIANIVIAVSANFSFNSSGRKPTGAVPIYVFDRGQDMGWQV